MSSHTPEPAAAAADLRAAIERGDATLVVMAPDAVRSGLLPAIEEFLAARTGARPVHRRWLQHSAPSIREFYPDSGDPGNRWWPYVEELFQTGPCVATIWLGPGASGRFPPLKGASHPADAAPGTLRARFCCDNPICNLVHVSDDPRDALREVGVLERLGLRPDEGAAAGRPVTRVNAPGRPVHCGLWTVAAVVDRAASQAGVDLAPLEASLDWSSREAWSRHMRWLGDAARLVPRELRDWIAAMTSGGADPSDAAAALGRLTAVSSWESLLIRCAARSQQRWLEVMPRGHAGRPVA